jgi:prepilin-type N-terminal cleavage/methylation domain-containing protein
MRRQDEGFTLIELLVTIAILGAVFSSVAAIAVVVLKAKRDADQALRNSGDVHVVATYFADDLAGSTNDPFAGLAPGTSTFPLGVLTLSGTDFSTGPWSHTYRLDTSAHVMTRDDVPVASNINSAIFAKGATAWSLTIDGCLLPGCATGAGEFNTITATRRT